MPSTPTARADKRAATLESLGKLAFNPGPIAAVMQAPGDDPDALIKVLQQCPVLTAKLIAVANSAGSGAAHRMDTLERCIRHLGGKQTRTIALTLAMQLLSQGLEVDDVKVESLWASATTKAVAAAMVAEVVSPELADRAYTLGLVQDIALPIFLAIDPAFFEPATAAEKPDMSWIEREQERFGIDHTELGAALLKKWNAAPELINAVRTHHAPLADDDMAWLAEMPTRFAGLLPHQDEAATPTQAQTLAAVHARFLSERYATLDSFRDELAKRVQVMGKAAPGPSRLGPELLQQITQAVAADTFALVAQVTRLDQQLAEHVDQLASVQTDALSDPLTGLLNRRGFEAFGNQMIAQAHKAGLAAACLVIDLDDFKPINDTFGHAAGDTLLQAASSLIRSSVAAGDLVARLGGDEFAILVTTPTPGDAHGLAQRVHATCNGRNIRVGQNQKATLKMSIGGVHQPNLTSTTTLDDLLDAADRVMYHCKQNGKAGLEFQALQRAAA